MTDSPAPALDQLLRELALARGSDLHLKAGRAPLFRVRGDLVPAPGHPALSAADVAALLRPIMPPYAVKQFDARHEADCAYQVPDLARFRVNVFQQRGAMGAVMRLIPTRIPTIEQLNLPSVLNELADRENGLVLVTGPTGSGKTTTLAAMIEHINRTRPLHIVTVEDPIEFVYEDKTALINQRELGTDTESLAGALRAALRQDPDIILMGEIRDPETVKFGITAAETGHLVFATLHTNNATQTLERIIDILPAAIHAVAHQQLALLLRGIVCQRLLKRKDGQGRIPAMEVMMVNETIRQLISESKFRGVEKAIEDGAYYKMQTFNQSLHALAHAGLISEETALESSENPDDLRLLFRGIRRGSGAEDSLRQLTADAKARQREADERKRRGF